MTEKEATQAHLEDAATKVELVVDDAREAAHAEQQMSILEGLRTYPKAIGWSVLLSTALVMEGYDVVLLGSFYALPAFRQKYGQMDDAGQFQISAPWQAGLSNGAQIGEILGLFASGIVTDHIGYRKTYIGALFLALCFVFVVFFSPNVQTLLAGEILCGIPWGVFQTLTTTYASEVCPVVLRAYLTTYVNLCWVFGQLIASGVLRAMSDKSPDDPIGYRLPFALQWIWPIPLMIGAYFAPESPWWLVRKGKISEAVHSIKRLARKGSGQVDAEKTVAMMIHTNEVEMDMLKGTSYWDLFKGSNRRRTEIASLVWSIQNLSGSTLQGYSTYFYEQAGLDQSFAFDFSIVQYALGIIGTVSSWFMMKYIGRRTMYVMGLSILFCVLLIIGFLSLGPKSNTSLGWAIGSMLLVHTFVYDLTIGPACYSLVPEIASTRLRAKSTVFARNIYNCVGIVNSVLTPYMLNPTAWNWGAKTGFFWAGICFLCLTWSYFRLPEPKGRTFAELDLLFEQGIPARKFRTTVVDPFAAHPRVRAENLAEMTEF